MRKLTLAAADGIRAESRALADVSRWNWIV